MKSWWAAGSIFVAGLLFGSGLVVSGMVNPGKVIGFLDITGDWDPSLIIVMLSGLLVTVPAFHMLLKKSTAVVRTQVLPAHTDSSRSQAGVRRSAVRIGLGRGRILSRSRNCCSCFPECDSSVIRRRNGLWYGAASLTP